MKRKVTHYSSDGAKRRKLLASAGMLLLSGIMLFTTSFAWLILSTAPEVTGISTNIGSNGSLEIALLNAETRADLNLIGSNIGDSISVKGALQANITWGNLVDLGDPSYGLDQIVMMPSQLQISHGDASGYTVTSGILAMPSYGTDGRIIELNANTVSSVYSGTFAVSGEQTYGVRGIGVVDSSAAGASAVGIARSNILAYSGTAKNNAISAISSNGNALLGISIKKATSSTSTFSDTELDSIKEILKTLNTSLSYIERALRYGMVAKVGEAHPENAIEASRSILSADISLTELFETYGEDCPPEMSDWIAKLASAQNKLNSAYTAAASLTGGSYTWDQINDPLAALMDINQVYLDDSPLTSMNVNDVLSRSSFTLTLLPGSGLLADISDYVGDYSTWINYLSWNVEFSVRTNETSSHLAALAATISSEAPVVTSTEITSLGGYAIDLAFRCNAQTSDLQLQIAPEQRVYTDSISGDLQGGGSYMQFSSQDAGMTAGRMVTLMDAIRVTFLDVEGKILAMAKLNTSNRSVQPDGSIKANLYLYDFSTARGDNGQPIVVVGARRTGDVKITELEQNIPKAVTVVVWLDGNIVDNTMVSAEYASSLSGILNLQFSSSADLIPAGNSSLYNSNSGRPQLNDLLAEDESEEPQPTPTSVYNAGQGSKYTDLSWKAFAAAYEYAARVSEDAAASSTQIRTAYNNLSKTYDELTVVSHEALKAKIDEIRAFTGSTDEIAAYAYRGVSYSAYSLEISENGTEIYRVDYNNNLHDEGNGIQTPIYKRDSWAALANALYAAEAADFYGASSDTQLNNAITNLELAYTSLERAVLYVAYDLDGIIYYRAITDEVDTYGKWYDEDYHRVISDLKILDLDTGATPAIVAKIEAQDYVRNQYYISSDNKYDLYPSLDLENNAYPKLKNDEIIAVRWGVSGLALSDINDDADASTAVSMSSIISSIDDVKAAAAEYNVTLENADRLESCRTSAYEVLNGTSQMSNDGIAQLMIDASDELVIASQKVNEAALKAAQEIEEARTLVSENERIILKAAIDEATRVLEGAMSNKDYDDEDYSDLNFALNEATAVYEQNENALKSNYEDKLGALNTAINNHEGTVQTAYNVPLYSFNDTDGYYEPTNRVVLPTSILRLSELDDVEDIGYIIVTARILTKNGVVYTADKTIKIYNPAEGIKLTMNMQPVDNTSPVIVHTKDIFRYEMVLREEEIDVGGETVKVTIPCNETAESYAWSVDDLEIVSIGSDATKEKCTITALKPGETTLTLTVTMDTGSVYTTRTQIKVES